MGYVSPTSCLLMIAFYSVGQLLRQKKKKKSLFFNTNTKPEVRRAIQQMYLGLPMASRKSKVNTFKELQEKITKRVMGWKEKLISKAGREILIKTVAQAIPTYSICLFKLPKAICDKINSLLANYWWGQTKDERKINWINWQKLCTQKKVGGIRFRDISAFNLAMLAKQA